MTFTHGSQLLAVASCTLLLAVAAGARAQECSADSDCPAGFECDLAPSAGSSVDCDPMSGSCDRAPEPEPPRGECEPAELRCKTNADCPSGAVCDLREDDCDSASAPSSGSDSDPAPGAGGAGGDAGAAAEPVATCEPPTEGECVVTLLDCKSDADCEGADVCTAFKGGSCAEAPTCAGAGCPPDPPDEPTCTERTISYCFPKPIDCGDGQACAKGTRCVELEEDIQEDAPPSWNGAAALCLPEVWALGLEGRIEIDGGGSSASDSASTTGEARNDSKSVGERAAGDEDATDGSGSSDSCTVSGPGSRSGGSFLLTLAAAALALAYRRRSATARRP